MSALSLGSGRLTLEQVREVAVNGKKVTLSAGASKRIERAHKFLLKSIEGDEKTIYGVNTGFGLFSDVRIEEKDIEALQYNLLRSHATGVGPHMSDSVVRAMLLLRASALAIGHSGASLKLVKHLVAMLNKNICPLIPSQGSCGASGDLAPLAHLSLPLIGEGRVRYKGRELSAKVAFKKAGLKPITLGPKEGLALINGTQFMSAIGTLNLLEAEYLCDVADATGALTLEAMRGTDAAFDADIQAIRPHPGQIHVAKRMRSFLTAGGKSEISKSHSDCSRVQDPYSLRCIPQVHGATRDTLTFVRDVLEREINSVTDNPLVFPAKNKILSGGNFHGQILAIAMDTLAIAVSELANISELRIEKLINPALSGLPAFLAPKSGLNSGFMIVQVAAASIVSENKTLCHPASVDSIPTSADKEDHVSMGAWAARKATRVIVNARRVLAMEMLCAAQGVEIFFLRPLRTSKKLEVLHKKIRTKVPKLSVDRAFHKDIEALEKLIANYEFSVE